MIRTFRKVSLSAISGSLLSEAIEVAHNPVLVDVDEQTEGPNFNQPNRLAYLKKKKRMMARPKANVNP